MRTAPYALRVDDHGLQICHCHRSGDTHVADFAAGDLTAFAAWLSRQPREARYRLAFDLADEHYQIESMPRVRGADRRALIARRFATHFGDSPVRWTHALGMDADAARQEKIVLHGLARSAALAPWLSMLERNGARLEAICPATLLMGHFAPRTLNLDGRLLFVSFTRCGMRVSQIERGVVHFSRLVPGVRSLADDWLHELDRTRGYLSAQPGGTDELRTIVLDPAPKDGAAGPLGDRGIGGGIECIAATRLLPAGAVPTTTGMAAIEAAQLHWLARAPRALHCSTARGRTAAGAERLHHIALYGGAVAVAGAVAIAGFRWTDAAALEHEATAVATRTAALRGELTQLETARGPLPAAAEDLLAVLDHLEREQTRHLPASAVFALVATALDATTGIELDHLSWQRPADAAAGRLINVALRLRVAAEPAAAAAALDALTSELERNGARTVERDTAVTTGAADAGPDDPVAARVGLRFRLQQDARP